jgi:hypothetical protein
MSGIFPSNKRAEPQSCGFPFCFQFMLSIPELLKKTYSFRQFRVSYTFNKTLYNP